MIVLQETNEIQTLRFTSKTCGITSFVFTNETTGVTETISNVDYFISSYYYFINEVFDFLKEGEFYKLEIFDNNSNLIFRDKIFVTNQEIDDYKLTSDFIQYSSDSNFITPNE
jgi:hypothetical protein